MTGPILIYPNDPAYNQARQNINHASDFYPAVIAICYTTAEVQIAVKTAYQNNWKIAVRSGGHSFENFSLNNNGMVIDVSPMTQVVQVGPNQAQVGPATQLIDVYTNLARYMNGTIPGGSCGTVAVAGLTLNGGYGLISRKFGLTCDTLSRVRLVTYDGTLVDSADDPALLWACQGAGGGNYGIVTEMYFNVVPAPTEATLFTLTWPYQELGSVISAWQEWVLNDLDDNTFSILKAPSAQNSTFTVGGQYLGPLAEAQAALAAWLAKAPARLSDSDYFGTMSYLSAIRYYDGEPSFPNWKNSSGFTAAPLSAEAITAILDWLGRAPSANCLLQMDSFGGAINQKSPSATAFPHRTMNFIYQFQAYWTTPAQQQAHHQWSVAFSTAIRDQYMLNACYRNYPDLSLNDWQFKYYANNYPALQQVKAKYDPYNVFQYPQSVELPEEGEAECT